ncbi:MAG: succinate dehydrogenase cytochrome b subunit [Rhodothermales bacterium]|nr:succinate dehydrogenase cytochrome b subunit [Rhodothermales bacterium]
MANGSDGRSAFYKSAVGRKIITGVTGIALTLFTIIHLVGNLSLLSSNQDTFNVYAEALASLGVLLYIAEIGLVAFFLVHAVIGISIYLRKRAARPVDYKVYNSAGDASKQSFASRSMIVTGTILLVFLVFHVLSFKYGPGVAEGYVSTVDGQEIRDLRRLVYEKFQSPLYAFGYPAVMILLGVHLRHGIWSGLTSLALVKPRLSSLVYSIGGVVGGLIALGFIILPLAIYFGGGA